jgi:LPS-assembly protein
VIDDSTDATIAPMVALQNGPAVDTQFRHVFNDGVVTVNASAANDDSSPQGDIFASGRFSIDDEWRWGFDLQRASSEKYMDDFHVTGNTEILTSQLFLEGFGQGSYSRVDVRAYQGLTSNVVTSRTPYVLPRYEYSFTGEPDALGGRTSIDVGAFNVLRALGTNTQRASLSADWERPVNGALGDLWTFVFHVDSAAYAAHQIDAIPTLGAVNGGSSAQGMPSAEVRLNWPFQRDAGSWGTQVVEPIVQLIGAPNGSSYGLNSSTAKLGFLTTLIPNEDSFDFEFTDANLFSLNRFSGIDRLEGGPRANVGLHGAWYLNNGQQFDALVGQGYRTSPDKAFPIGSGLDGTVTDIVDHLTYMPNSWFDVTTRERIDHRTYNIDFADVSATGGPSWLRLNGGFLYSKYNPFTFYDQVPTQVLTPDPRAELTFGGKLTEGPWRLSASSQYNIWTQQPVGLGVGGGYEDECFIFDVEFYQRYTSLNNDHGASSLLFQITFKTVGTFGFHSL